MTGDELSGTGDLLKSGAVSRLMEGEAGKASILVFKNTHRVEAVIKGKGWNVLNPPATLSERVENKLSQVRWLGDLSRYLPSHSSKLAKQITWKGGAPFIIQWAHGHTGDGTILIKTPDDLQAVKDKFPERMARISAFVSGESFTVNAVVTPERILMGSPSYQITGLEPFTDNIFSTIGNDWAAALIMLSGRDRAEIEKITAEVGKKLQTDGWKGLFGVDFIRDDRSGRFYLIEVNARQPASATYESSLQEEKRKAMDDKGLTTFEAHIRALLGLPIDQDIIQAVKGAQIVQRVTKNVQTFFDDLPDNLKKKGCEVVAYENKAFNADLLRIQIPEGIMAGHNSFNQKGLEIARALKDANFKIQL
jgi:hypothetical protein